MLTGAPEEELLCTGGLHGTVLCLKAAHSRPDIAKPLEHLWGRFVFAWSSWLQHF